MNTLTLRSIPWNMSNVPALKEDRRYWNEVKKSLPIIDDILEKHFKAQSLVSNTLSTSLADSIQKLIRLDHKNTTNMLTSFKTLLTADHQNASKLIKSILSKGNEFKQTLDLVQNTASQLFIVYILLGAILLLLIILITMTHYTRVDLITQFAATVMNVKRYSAIFFTQPNAVIPL